MRRVLFRWGGVAIHSYPAMLWLGIVLGLVAQEVAANARGIDTDRTLLATLLLLIPALAGSRLLYLALHWRSFRRRPGDLWRRSDGGAALYGGLVLVLPLSAPLLAGFEL